MSIHYSVGYAVHSIRINHPRSKTSVISPTYRKLYSRNSLAFR